MPPIPPITQFLMLACTAIFCLQQISPIARWLALFPVGSGMFMPWQPLTYAFLHADVFHLFFNMLGLWMFGAELEVLWGRKRYGAFLAMGALFGAITFALVTTLLGVPSALVGFSGAIYALLLASAMLFPTRIIMPLFPPIPMKMRTFVIVFGAIAVVLGFNGYDYGALAHLGGMLGGWITIRYWRGQAPFSRRR
ncbi:MAG: rhomboid family intramembrane serine protease [Cytophagales bacterium]|nr:rhomboid family intramembrane serine protease [Rhizobacter sp.]